MLFIELILENFGAYCGRHVIDLRTEINGESRPIILFGGMNGGGKTTLLDAIRLALYGPRAQCSTRNNLSYGEFLTQSVNNQAAPGDSTRIELTFEHLVDEGWKELKIVRTWTRDNPEGKDTLGIFDGEWPDTGLASIWDEYIENLLPLGISNLFLFDGEQVKELADQDIPPESVVSAIKSLLGLELAERLAIDLEILLSRKLKDGANASQLAKLTEVEGNLEKLLQEQEAAKEDCYWLQERLKIAEQKYQEIGEKFHLEGGKLVADEQGQKNERNRMETAIENQGKSLINLAGEMLPLVLVKSLLEEGYQTGERELKLEQAKIAQEVLQGRDQRLLAFLDSLALTKQKLAKIEAFLTEENQSLTADVDQDSKPWLGLTVDELRDLEQVIRLVLPREIEQAQEEMKQLQELEWQLERWERQNTIAASPEAFQKLNQGVKVALEAYTKAQADYTTGQRKLQELSKAIAQQKRLLQDYTEKTLDQQRNEKLIERIILAQQTIELFRERLTLKKLNQLEMEITECFRYLLHKSNLVHRVAIATNDFSLSLYDPQGKPLAKHRLSAGEKQLLAIAFLWSLARVSGRNLPIAIDTPLGRLDSSHRHHLIERYFPTASHQVILLSTDTEIGQAELAMLQHQDAIARCYLLEYDATKRQTKIQRDRYFWT